MLIARLILVVVATLVLVDCSARLAGRQDVDVSFRSGDVTLAGTLSVPPGRARRWPIAVFVSGDGPQDRDAGGLFRVLADSLVAHGIAVIRHDDRGAGHSTTPTGPPSYFALLDDTRAAISFVRNRGEIDPRRVVLVGHSEGAKTCEVLAARDPSIAGIALLAGATAVNVDTLLEEQARLDPGGPAPGLMLTLERAKAGEHAQHATDLTDWMREHLEIAPRAVLPQIHCPTLIMQGDADRLVRPHHAAEAAALIEGGGNRHVMIRRFAGLSHAFNRWAPGIEPSPEVTRTDPVVAKTLAEWVVMVVSSAPQNDSTIVALGNEPFWNVRVTPHEIVYTDPEHPDGYRFPPAIVVAEGDVRVYRTRRDIPASDPGPRTLELRIQQEACSDGMSDRQYAMSAAIKIGDDTRTGCAQYQSDAPPGARP